MTLRSLNRYGLPTPTFFRIINILKSYSTCIEKATLFGSRARGDYQSTSDIDIAVVFRKNADLLFRIHDELNEANIIYSIDLIDYNLISNEKLKQYIDREGKVIFLTDAEGKVLDNMNKVIDKLMDLEKALSRLKEVVNRDATKDDIVIDATIQRFEFTYELSWKLMKTFLEYNGVMDVSSPRRAIREAFKATLIQDGENWLKMLEDRNRTSHTYQEATALEIYINIKSIYVFLIEDFVKKMKENIDLA